MIVKAINANVSTIKKIMNYLKQAFKTDEWLLYGYNCNPETAFEQMDLTKRVFDKTGGRKYKHHVLSAKIGETTPQVLFELAVRLIEGSECYRNYEVLLAVHKDKDFIHAHIITNTVSFIDGRKFHESPQQLETLKDNVEELCAEYGLDGIPSRGAKEKKPAKSKAKTELIERAKVGEYDSTIYRCFQAVVSCRKKSKSREEFIGYLADEGYTTVWDDNRKYITFTAPDGSKFRNSNLQKTFGEDLSKDGLLSRFEDNERGEVLNTDELLTGKKIGIKEFEETVKDLKEMLKNVGVDVGQEVGQGVGREVGLGR